MSPTTGSHPPQDATAIESSQQLGTWATLRRGLDLSPELAKGIGVTVALALISTVGRVVVPFVVQQTTDRGILATSGPDIGLVLRLVLLAACGVVLTAVTSYFVNVRLFRASESGLATLRIKAFRHIHDLSLIHI